MRLDRFVSHASGCSRREAREHLRKGRVSVDGNLIRDPGFAVGGESRVVCDGARLQLPGALYLMMHKPCGVLSATRDRAQPTVLSLLPPDLASRVHLVGRLDKDTSGLLLLTDDGGWSHRISSPRHRCPKVYVADRAAPRRADAEARAVLQRRAQRLEPGLVAEAAGAVPGLGPAAVAIHDDGDMARDGWRRITR